jgi:PTS system mannose-specific IIB component
MPVVLYRIDNRLVHGQVLEAWVPRVGADTILVVDDNLLEDDFHRTIIEAMGHGRLQIKVAGCSSAQSLLTGALSGKKVLVLFHDTEQAFRAHSAGVDYKVLNIGNIHPGQGNSRLTGSVHLTRDDAHRLCKLISSGVRVEVRAVPSDKSLDVESFCRTLDGGAQ